MAPSPPALCSLRITPRRRWLTHKESIQPPPSSPATLQLPGRPYVCAGALWREAPQPQPLRQACLRTWSAQCRPRAPERAGGAPTRARLRAEPGGCPAAPACPQAGPAWSPQLLVGEAKLRREPGRRQTARATFRAARAGALTGCRRLPRPRPAPGLGTHTRPGPCPRPAQRTGASGGGGGRWGGHSHRRLCAIYARPSEAFRVEGMVPPKIPGGSTPVGR